MTTLRVPALQLRQGLRHIYCFGVDGKQLSRFAAVSRVRRDDNSALSGYQRPEALAHIRGIRRYLENSSAILPNALVLAFDNRVSFTPAQLTSPAVDYSMPGELVIPIDDTLPEHERPAWLVDGQQRAAAIRDARVGEFPIAAVGFIARSEEEQRSQFILVNSTKTLPPGLIHELLPATTGQVPHAYERRRVPAAVMAALNRDAGGPFGGVIKSPTAPLGYIQDTSVLKMVEHSLTDGCLYQYRNPATGEADLTAITAHLTTYWAAVAGTWQTAWTLPPRKSRLTHGAGISAMGYVMDALTEDILADELDPAGLRRQLAALAPHTAWTRGTWQIDGEVRRWDSVQNTSKDITALSRHLINHLPAAGAT
ncbi:DGQHR domain-containing protein [Saccharothrix sp. AJ9571]|nr:DGQHR domain-containing protein [Saccharothrix sp. AJ9571]